MLKLRNIKPLGLTINEQHDNLPSHQTHSKKIKINEFANSFFIHYFVMHFLQRKANKNDNHKINTNEKESNQTHSKKIIINEFTHSFFYFFCDYFFVTKNELKR